MNDNEPNRIKVGRPYAEKRDYIRMNLQAEFNYSESGQTEHITAFCNNLSHTGIQFTTSKALQPAQVIDIYFKTEHAKFQPLKGTVEVIRCTPTEEKTFVVAGKIIEYK